MEGQMAISSILSLKGHNVFIHGGVMQLGCSMEL